MSPARMTAPTMGFGATRPQPRRARSRARSMAARSAGGRSESEPNADTSEGMGRLGIEAGERRRERLVLACLQANLAYQLDGREGEAAVHEDQGAGVGRVDHHRPDVGRAVIEPDVSIGRLVAVDPDSGGDIYEDEPPPRHCAIAVALQIHGELEVVPRAGGGAQRPVPKAWHGAMHPAHRYGRDPEAAVEHADPSPVSEPQSRVADVGGIRVTVRFWIPVGRMSAEPSTSTERSPPPK